MWEARLIELKKGKYKQQEVAKLLEACETEYFEKINELKERLEDLTEQNNNLLAEIEIYKKDKDLVSQSIIDAQKKAKEIELKAQSSYTLSISQLKAFMLRWVEYFKYLSEKYPYYPAVKQSVELCKEVNSILDRKSSQEVVGLAGQKLSEVSSRVDDFNPKGRIQDYIATTGDNGFNLDEVLNPGDLRLEDLCRELGLLEENDL